MTKKHLVSIATAAAMSVMFAFHVFASPSGDLRYPCAAEGCQEYGEHTHDGNTYYGHGAGCTVEGCQESGEHTHDGVTYYGHSVQCPVSGCQATGAHYHDGTSCYNYQNGSSQTGHRSGHGHGCGRRR